MRDGVKADGVNSNAASEAFVLPNVEVAILKVVVVPPGAAKGVARFNPRTSEEVELVLVAPVRACLAP